MEALPRRGEGVLNPQARALAVARLARAVASARERVTTTAVATYGRSTAARLGVAEARSDRDLTAAGDDEGSSRRQRPTAASAGRCRSRRGPGRVVVATGDRGWCSGNREATASAQATLVLAQPRPPRRSGSVRAPRLDDRSNRQRRRRRAVAPAQIQAREAGLGATAFFSRARQPRYRKATNRKPATGRSYVADAIVPRAGRDDTSDRLSVTTSEIWVSGRRWWCRRTRTHRKGAGHCELLSTRRDGCSARWGTSPGVGRGAGGRCLRRQIRSRRWHGRRECRA